MSNICSNDITKHCYRVSRICSAKVTRSLAPLMICRGISLVGDRGLLRVLMSLSWTFSLWTKRTLLKLDWLTVRKVILHKQFWTSNKKICVPLTIVMGMSIFCHCTQRYQVDAHKSDKIKNNRWCKKVHEWSTVRYRI